MKLKTKLKFVGNLVLLAIFDVAILMNYKVIYDKGFSIDIIENVILLVAVVLGGIAILKDTYDVGRQFILERKSVFDTDPSEDEWLEEDYIEEEY